jgi:hypothetical protein
MCRFAPILGRFCIEKIVWSSGCRTGGSHGNVGRRACRRCTERIAANVARRGGIIGRDRTISPRLARRLSRRRRHWSWHRRRTDRRGDHWRNSALWLLRLPARLLWSGLCRRAFLCRWRCSCLLSATLPVLTPIFWHLSRFRPPTPSLPLTAGMDGVGRRAFAIRAFRTMRNLRQHARADLHRPR